jgi:hypothetical protein|tara:strand:+ start:73 stop:381 length:309 start_codon:yes stop_codon:yes gene_type:complete
MIKLWFSFFFIAFSYYLAWYLFKVFDLHWHTVLNIPGFLLLIVSWPLSSIGLNQFFEFELALFIKAILTSFGFASNLTVIFYLVVKLIRFVGYRGVNDKSTT